MTENLVLLVIVAVAIPFVVMGGLWLFARAMDRLIPSRRAKLAIWGSCFIIWVWLAFYDYIEGRAFWWVTAAATIVWAAGWFHDFRQKEVRDGSVGPQHG